VIQKSIAFLKEVKGELTQVSWSAPRELWGSTKVVLVTIALLSLVIGTFDFVSALLMNWIIR